MARYRGEHRTMACLTPFAIGAREWPALRLLLEVFNPPLPFNSFPSAEYRAERDARAVGGRAGGAPLQRGQPPLPLPPARTRQDGAPSRG